MLGYGQVSDLDFQTDQPNLASLSQELNETRAILAEAQQALRALGYDKNYTDEARTTASQLVTSEAFALTILESSPDCLKVLTADGLIEYINQNGACLLEVNDYRTILGQHWKTFWPENVRPIIIQSIEAALSGQSINFTALAPTVRGTEKHWDISLAAIPSEAGHPVKLLVVSRDVTDKVQSEIALAESEARFRGTFENAAVGVAHIALGGTWLAVNDKVCSIFGYSRQELLAKTLPHITHDEDLAADIHQRDRILSGEIDAYSMDKRYYHKDGSVVWGSLTVSLQRHVDGRPDYFISIIEDISARIAVEATLRETQAKYQAALRLGRIGAWETDYINGTRHWSQEAMSLFGISLVGGIGHVGPSDELYSALHPDDAGLPDLITRSLRTDDNIQVRYRIIRPDGQILTLLGYGEVMARDPAGAVTRLTNVVADISDWVRAEEAVKANDIKFQAIQDSSLDGFMMLDSVRNEHNEIIDFRWTHVNAAAAEIVGHTPEWFLGARLLVKMPGNKEDGLFDAYVHVVETGQPHTAEMSYRHEGLDIYIRIVTVKAGDGFAVTFADLSARRRAEEKVADSEARLASAIAAGQLGVYEIDVRTGAVIWDMTARNLWGVSQNGIYDYTAVDSCIHPDDLANVKSAFDAVLKPEGPGNISVEYRVINRRDGITRWVISQGDAKFTDGVAVRVVGTVRDITLRKEAEATRQLLLEESTHRIKNILATVNAITSQTLRSDNVPLAVRQTVAGRLVALASAHDVLMQNDLPNAELNAIISSALSPYIDLRNPRIVMLGKNAVLESKASIGLSLCLHELATNAVKYGALSNDEGMVRVDWQIENDVLRLTWKENGGPPVTPPTRKGFGSSLIQRALTSDLNGTAVVSFLPEGVVCDISASVVSADAAT